MSPDEALASVPASLRSSGKHTLPSEKEAEEFIDKVDDIARLINGLHEGTLPPEYIDSVLEEKEEKRKADQRKAEERKKKEVEAKTLTPEREAELRERAAELEASYRRKIKCGYSPPHHADLRLGGFSQQHRVIRSRSLYYRVDNIAYFDASP